MRITLAAAAVVAALTFVAPASATTLGSSGAAGTTCSADLAAWQTDASATVPEDGIIMSLATNATTVGKHITLKVFRPSDGGATVVASTPEITEVAGVNSVAMNAPVQAGDVLGVYTSDGANCAVSAGAGGTVSINSAVGGDPPVGATVTPDAGGAATLAISATFEADADHDGFGDETQDSCPTDPGIHTGPCVTDLSAVQSVTPTTIGVGDVAVATLTLANGSTGLAQGVTATAKVTPGLQVLSLIPGNGCSFTPDLSCSFGSLSGHASTVAALVVRGVTPGAQSLSTVVAPTANDPNAANNTATTPITVEKRVALKCNVPSLKGLTKAVAKRLLTATNCKLGKIKKTSSKHGKKGTVIKQAKKAGTKLRAGSKVNVTLKK